MLSVDEVLHKLNELAFARSLTTSAGGHDEIIAAVGTALENRRYRAEIRAAPANAAAAAR